MNQARYWVCEESVHEESHGIGPAVSQSQMTIQTRWLNTNRLADLTLHEVESVVGQDDKNTVIKAIVSAAERNDAQVEQITSRLSLERDVVGISWQALPVAITE
jgi:cyanate lyase